MIKGIPSDSSFSEVHAFAEQIGREEGIPEKQLFVLEAAAYVHDIGIHRGEMEFGGMMERYRRNWGRGKHAYIGKTRIRDGRY